jgi:hypothetical protein
MATVAAASLLTSALAFSGAAGAATGKAMPFTTVAGARLHLKLVRVPEASGRVDHGAFEIISEEKAAPAYCLDANDQGSSAGKNGDKVQLWACQDPPTPNQEWFLNGTDPSNTNFTELANDEYQNDCLNANDTGGLVNGSRVQLWSCGAASANEFWDTGFNDPNGWQYCLEDTVGNDCRLYLLQDYPDFVLNANSSGIGNGDYVQVWSPQATGPNTEWWSGQG